MDTAPNLGLALAAVVLAAVTLLVTLAYAWQTQPREPSRGPSTHDLGAEPAAIVNFLTEDFTVTPAAVPATMLDLAVRNWLTVEDVGTGNVVIRLGSDRSGDVLSPYEQRVLAHLDGLAVGAVVPAEAMTTGTGDAFYPLVAGFSPRGHRGRTPPRLEPRSLPKSRVGCAANRAPHVHRGALAGRTGRIRLRTESCDVVMGRRTTPYRCGRGVAVRALGPRLAARHRRRASGRVALARHPRLSPNCRRLRRQARGVGRGLGSVSGGRGGNGTRSDRVGPAPLWLGGPSPRVESRDWDLASSCRPVSTFPARLRTAPGASRGHGTGGGVCGSAGTQLHGACVARRRDCDRGSACECSESGRLDRCRHQHHGYGGHWLERPQAARRRR